MKICLITGATRGLGLSLSRWFKNNEFHTVGLARDKSALQQLEKDGILDDGFVCDLSNLSSVDEFLGRFTNKYDRLDVLINNAAIQNSYDITTHPEYFCILHKELTVNFTAPVKITSDLLPLLLKQKSKVIVITSVLQIGPKKSAPGYSAGKSALANWTANLRAQLVHSDVSVVEVIPGLIKTTMTEKAAATGVDPEILAKRIGMNLNKTQIVLPGAKPAWTISKFMPDVLRTILLKSEN